MDKITNEELVDEFIQGVTYSNPDCMEMKHELLSRLARVQELEAEVESWKDTAVLEADGLESWKKAYEKLEQQLARLKKENEEFLGVLDINNDLRIDIATLQQENAALKDSTHHQFKNCGDAHVKIVELIAEVERLKEQVDYERNKAGHLEWVKGQRAVEKLERIRVLVLWLTEDTEPPYRVMPNELIIDKIRNILAEEG